MNHMKQIYTTIAASFLLCAGLVSCEMKKELFGNDEIPTETGLVELGVDVDDKTNVVVTKAEATDNGVEQGASVDPSDFPVSFTLKTNTNYKKEFIYSDIEGKTVELPIGTYEVVSHTPGKMEKEMSAPYYKGSNELAVAKEVTQQAKIICTMQNTRIVVVYPEDFQKAFSEWTITIDDGTENALTFVYDKENQDLNPAAKYWAISENCSSLSISIKATTTEGASVSESRSITKPADAEDKNWVGGDALTITMKPIENNVGYVSGIKINVSTFFETENNESVEVPIEDEDNTETPTDPDEGEDGDEEPTEEFSLTFTQTECTLPDDMAKTVNAEISTPGGLESLYIEIEGGNEMFQDIADQFLDGGKFELIDCKNKTIIDALNQMKVDLPSKGMKQYNFPISAFFSLLDAETMGPTDDGKAHIFNVTVKDAKYGEKKGAVSIIVK